MTGKDGMRAATPADSGKACPYCRFALKAGAGVVACPSCSATHHDECWGDNGGCAVMGCASAPSLAAGAPPTAATARQPPPPPPPAYPPPQATAPAPPPRSGTPVLTAAVLLLALALAGTAVALVVSSRSAPPERVATDPTTSAPTVTVTKPGSSTQTQPDPPERAVDAAEIETLLDGYYGAVQAGDFARAWRMLSPTYKTWKADNGGYAKWQRQERGNRARLRVDDLDVKVRFFDPPTDVATIFVSGMRFERRDGSMCAYEGFTWVRRFDGEWLYDQGYLQNADRAAVWRPRSRETLGVGCDESGY